MEPTAICPHCRQRETAPHMATCCDLPELERAALQAQAEGLFASMGVYLDAIQRINQRAKLAAIRDDDAQCREFTPVEKAMVELAAAVKRADRARRLRMIAFGILVALVSAGAAVWMMWGGK